MNKAWYLYPNRFVEEFMLLANMAVAHRIYKAYPDLATLRRHPEPQSRMVDDLVRLSHLYDCTEGSTLYQVEVCCNKMNVREL